MNKFIAAIIQIDTQNNKYENLSKICTFIDEAAKKGAKLVAMPEHMNYFDVGVNGQSEEIPGGKTFQLMAEKAKKYSLWLHCGSIYETDPQDSCVFNTTMLINPHGELVAKYRKIHLFNANLPDGLSIKESAKIRAGNKIVTVDTGEVGHLGLAICYDIRFSEMFRSMTLNGAQIFVTAANFISPIGDAHWETLVRARAIENQCYMIAPGQIGQKPKFRSYGHSMIVDPWGKILAEASYAEQVITAEINLDYMTNLRQLISST